MTNPGTCPHCGTLPKIMQVPNETHPSTVQLNCPRCGASASAPVLPLLVEPPGFARMPVRDRTLMLVMQAASIALANLRQPD